MIFKCNKLGKKKKKGEKKDLELWYHSQNYNFTLIRTCRLWNKSLHGNKKEMTADFSLIFVIIHQKTKLKINTMIVKSPPTAKSVWAPLDNKFLLK